MKKKLMTLLLMLALALSAMACSDNGDSAESEKTVDEASGETTDEATDDSTVGEIVEENGIRKEPIITDKDLNRSGETGPIKYNIKELQVSKLTATTDEMASLLDIDKDTEVALVALNIEIENTSTDTISIYPDQGTLTTDTKEQVNADMFLSDSIGGEMIGEVKKDGTIFFVLKKSKADEINTITYYVDGPHDEDLNTVGDEIKEELNFK